MPTPNARATLLRQRSHLHLELARIDAELAAIECAASAGALPDVYSTAPGGTHPGSHRWFVERCRKNPKARRIGGKRGRGVSWEIDRADWEAAEYARRAHSTNDSEKHLCSDAPEGASAKPAPVVSIDSWISAGGYRATRAG